MGSGGGALVSATGLGGGTGGSGLGSTRGRNTGAVTVICLGITGTRTGGRVI
jgi:hypothetical protein